MEVDLSQFALTKMVMITSILFPDKQDEGEKTAPYVIGMVGKVGLLIS